MKPRRPLPAPVRSTTPEAPAVVVAADPAADVLADLAANAGLAPAAADPVSPAPVVEAAPAPKPAPKAPPKAPAAVVVDAAPAPVAAPKAPPKAPPSAAPKAVAVLPEGCVAVPRAELELLIAAMVEAKGNAKGQKEWFKFMRGGFAETRKWASAFSFEATDAKVLEDLLDDGRTSADQAEAFAKNVHQGLSAIQALAKKWLG